MTGVTEQLLTFVVHDQQFGVDVLRVQEIRAWMEPTPMPQVPSWVRGVVNIRGTLIPVVDLSERLGRSAVTPGPLTAMVVLRTNTAQGEAQVLGVIVDTMNEVLTVAPEHFMPPPALEAGGSTSAARAFVIDGQSLITVLNVDALFGALGGNSTRS